MAIDYGRRRIGLAVSDESNILATPLSTIDCRRVSNPIGIILNFVKYLDITKILVGYPFRADGSAPTLGATIDNFILSLAKETSVEIVKYDESYSTEKANQYITVLSRKQKNFNKNKVDRFAATVFLQEYLNEIKS